MDIPEAVWIGVTGDFASGKTALIRSLTDCDYEVVDSLVPGYPNLGFDVGRLTIDNEFELHLYGRPGAFSPLATLQIKKPGRIGVIVMVRSDDPRYFPVTGSIIETYRAYYDFPLIIAANSQNADEVLSPEDLRIVLRVPDYVPIVPCVAIDKESSKQVVLSLLYHVLDLIETAEQA